MAVTIDTHAAIQDLEAASADPKLAEAIVKIVSQAGEQLATKAYLATLRSELAGDIQTTIAGLERRLIGYLLPAVVIVLGRSGTCSTI